MPQRTLLFALWAIVVTLFLGIISFQLVAYDTALDSGNYVVDYTIQAEWENGATISITIRNNTSATVNGWSLGWTFPGEQRIITLWNGTYTQSGATVSVKDVGFNANIPADDGSVNFGFNLNYSGIHAVPAEFTLNGTPCIMKTGVSPTPTIINPLAGTPGSIIQLWPIWTDGRGMNWLCKGMIKILIS